MQCYIIGRFNPRAHVGRDPSIRDSYLSYCVSIHAPTWGATKKSCIRFNLVWFQSTRPRGARPTVEGIGGILICFNPRAHVGRDEVNCRSKTFPPVSIHAPTWGATDIQLNKPIRQAVSIHAPTWGATVASVEPTTLQRFQSTRPRGARHSITPEQLLGVVSIHAPTWGATGTTTQSLIYLLFQSTRPRGARLTTWYCQS